MSPKNDNFPNLLAPRSSVLALPVQGARLLYWPAAARKASA